MLFGMILRYLGFIHDSIKAIVAESGEFLSMVMIDFLETVEWPMLAARFNGRI